MPALELHVDELRIRPWQTGDTEAVFRACHEPVGVESSGLNRVDWRATVGNHASRLTALRLGFRMIGTWPAPDRWLGTLTREDFREAGRDLPDSVRRSALTFGGEQPVLDAGTVTLRRPSERDVPGVVACFNDPDVMHWFGVAQPWTDAEGLRYVTVRVPERWTGGEEAAFAVVDPDNAYQGSVDLRILGTDPAAGEVGFFVAPRARASRRVAEKAGFTMEGLLRQALVINGVRRDCWIGSLLRKDVA